MIIEAKNVSIVRDRKHLLKSINWDVKNDENWVILGLNGSGKTMLLNLINGYIFPTSGKVSVFDREFGKHDLRETRKSIGWVSSALNERIHDNDTVLDIVLSGKFSSIGLYDDVTENDLEEAYKIINTLKITDLKDRKYCILSQGEKQRTLIGRSLMGSPDLLILDEPCTGLDIFSRDILLSVIEELIKKKNGPRIIYVTHHVDEILSGFGNILFLKKGEVYLSGKMDSLMTSDKLSDFFDAPVLCKNDGKRYHIELVKGSKI